MEARERQGLEVREARDQDVPAIREIFETVYGREYPHAGFFDERWLKRSVYSDDILMLVAEDRSARRVLGTASVVFDIGAHSDLIGEFGRLAVHPDARGRGVGGLLMDERVARIQGRLHVGLVENRCVHSFSQRISHSHGFAPVGFQVMKHLFRHRESIALFCRHFGDALDLRKNHPRIVPEAHALAHVALANCGLPQDAIVDEEAAPYPPHADFELEELEVVGLPALLRIERGRLRGREIFGPMRLQYGFFKLTAKHATYLIARQEGGPVAGAIGYIVDDLERTVRVFELISRSDRVVRFLFEQLLERCRSEWGTAYVEADVSAHAPRMQRTLVELGFLPTAYVPAMVFHEVERLDVVKLAKLLVPLDLGPIELTPPVQVVAGHVLRAFERQAVLPRIAEAVHEIDLFRSLNEEQTTRVAGVCTVAEFEAGARIFSRGDAPRALLLPLEGRARVTLGDPPRVLGEVGVGEALGELSLLTGEPHSADATAETALTAAALSREALAELTRQRPDIGVVLYRQFAIGLGRKLQRLDASLAAAED